MNTKVHNFPADEVPLPCPYGSAELKGFIRKYTIRGVLITLVLFILFFITFLITNKIREQAQAKVFEAPIVRIDLENLPPPTDAMDDFIPPPAQQIIHSGPAARAGNPIPVPDAMITPDMQDFATIDVVARASAAGGDGLDIGNFAPNINFDAERPVRVEIKEVEPEMYEFIPVEKEPGVDLGKLQSLVVYPDLARRAGVEGTVVLRVLVDKDGSVRRMVIESSDNQLLNPAAEDAIKKYGKFTPAIQNQQPIQCWVSIPIRFRLR